MKMTTYCDLCCDRGKPGGQKGPLTSLEVSAEVTLELKFEGYVGVCQVKREEEEHVWRLGRAV